MAYSRPYFEWPPNLSANNGGSQKPQIQNACFTDIDECPIFGDANVHPICFWVLLFTHICKDNDTTGH